MDSFIQMLPLSFRKFSSYIDFEGQKKAERIFQVVITLSGVIGFIIGYIVQQLSIAMYSTIAGFVIASIITLPPWPMYRRHPLHWQQNVVQSDQDESKKSGSKQQKSAKKGESKKRR